MTVVLISGGLTFLVGLLILRPYSPTGGRLHVRAHAPDDDRRRELLRQLRDLDDDLAAGKLTSDDHARLRDPVEREAAAVLGRKAQRPAVGTAVTAPAPRPGPAPSGPPQGRGAGAGARRWRRPTVALLALAGAAASIAVLLVGAVSSRHAGQTITGNSVAGAAPVAGSVPVAVAGSLRAGSAPVAVPNGPWKT